VKPSCTAWAAAWSSTPSVCVRPMIHTWAAGARITRQPSASPAGAPGGISRWLCAPVPVVRLPGAANTSVRMSSIAIRTYLPPVSPRDTRTGSSVRSSQALEYRVSKVGRTTARKSAAGNARRWWNRFGGPAPGAEPAGLLTRISRVTSIVTSGYRYTYAS